MSLNLSRFGQETKMRKWFVGLLLLALIVPGFSTYAMPAKQPANDGLPPCHQMLDHDQTSKKVSGAKGCCGTLHQCDGSCDHGCSDCFSTGHFFALISLPAESPRSTNTYSLPVSIYHNGLSLTLLLRPPRHSS